jgi:ATP-dependent 26S proteasome regulatory subunit
MGVLLNGVKGTGKTITAKILANKLNLPIILIGTKHPEMSTFISSISQDLVIFIDEYEKIYSSGSFYENDEDDGITKKGGDSNLLALMDGAYKTAHRRFFILTTNNLWVNENLLNRPGRIRYKKNFADLNYIQINQIIEDFLEDKKWKDSIISFMKPLSIITVDIVKSIIEEINIHNEPPEVCCKDFNVENKEETYTVIKLQPNQEKTIAQNVPAKVVLRFIDKAVTDWQNNYLRTETLDLIMAEENTEPNIFTVRNLYGDNKPKYKIKFQKEMFIHKSLTI